MVWVLRLAWALRLSLALPCSVYCVLIKVLHLLNFRSRRQVLGVTAVTTALTKGKTAAPRDEQRLRIVASAVFEGNVAGILDAEAASVANAR